MSSRKSPSAKKGVVKKRPTAAASAELAVGLVEIVKKQVKSVGPGTIGLLSDPEVTLAEVTEWIPSRFPQIDYILGGGWPVGRAVEVFGPEGLGKSALTHAAIKSCQSIGGTVLCLDFETSLDPDKMARMKIDPNRLIYAVPDHIDQAWDIIWTVVDDLQAKPPDAPFLIVWDSIAASVPKAELEAKSAADTHVALIARSMSQGCRKMYKRIAKVRACMMWVNQIRAKIGSFGFGAQTETPGGKAVKFASSIRLCVAYTKYIRPTKEDPPNGYQVFVKTVKNKLFPPHRKASWVLDFQHGPSPELSMFRALLDAKEIKVAGGGYYSAPWSDLKFKKRDSWLQILREDAEFRKGAKAAFAQLIVEERKADLGESG